MKARVVYERIAKVARQFLSVSVLDAGYVPADEQVSAWPCAGARRSCSAARAAPPASASRQLAMRLEQGVAGKLDTAAGSSTG